ncbi:MAG: hypothetical protein H0X03_08675 [Nitrosopumilus sp.]|nr:hypothetical protein [Nitrosopumilus sp.]
MYQQITYYNINNNDHIEVVQQALASQLNKTSNASEKEIVYQGMSLRTKTTK